MKPIPINEKLIWDYDIPPDAQENEAFRAWYVKRVLLHGSDTDLRGIGFDTIHHYLPQMILPRHIREFWEWYFNLPDVERRYGNLDPLPEKNPNSSW